MVSESEFNETDDDEDFGESIGGSIYLCSFTGCQKTFRRKDRLRFHMSVHEGKKPYVCMQAGCDKAYTRPAGLKRHVSGCHTVKKYAQVYSCCEEKCDKNFMSLHSLHRHVKRIHEDCKLQCSHCPKTFKKRQQFKIHEFQHTGIKPFRCSMDGCSREFLLPSKLRAHMKCHKGYKCTSEGCESSFTKWTLLQKHLKTDHVPVHRCSTCKKVLSNSANLRSHEATHGVEREIFTCPKNDCNRFYYFARNLTQHMKAAHDDGSKVEPGHKCSHADCSKKFKHKSSLDRHLKLHAVGAKMNKPKMTRKCRKRRSMAAHLSGYVGTKEEEMAILYPGTLCPDESAIPSVILVQNSPTIVSSEQTTRTAASQEIVIVNTETVTNEI